MNKFLKVQFQKEFCSFLNVLLLLLYVDFMFLGQVEFSLFFCHSSLVTVAHHAVVCMPLLKEITPRIQDYQ